MIQNHAILLALDTSTPTGGVAVGQDARLLAELVLGPTTRHSEALLPATAHVLGIAGLTTASLEGIVVASGPGSFTGLRIAGATAKAMARALNLPLHAYSGLLALAASAGRSGAPVCALFDARRDEVYAACYVIDEVELRTVLSPGARKIEELLIETAGIGALFVGEGALKHEARIREAGGAVALSTLSAPRASALLWLAAHHPDAGRVTDLAAWEPEYMRETGAERSIQP